MASETRTYSMRRYVVLIDGCTTSIRYTLDETVEKIVKARERGERWDVRMKTEGQRYRLPTEAEAAELVNAILGKVLP